MSIDASIFQDCNHLVSGEVSILTRAFSLSTTLKYPIPASNSPLTYIKSLHVGSVQIPTQYMVVTPNTQIGDYELGGTVLGRYVNVNFSKFPDAGDFTDGMAMQVTYVCVPQSCPFCGGAGVKSDIDFEDGVLKTVSGNDLAAQVSERALLVRVGTAPYHAWFGSTLNKVIGARYSSIDLAKSDIEDRVRASLESIVDIMTMTREGTGLLSESESIGSINGVIVEYAGSGMFHVQVDIELVDGEAITLQNELQLHTTNFISGGN